MKRTIILLLLALWAWPAVTMGQKEDEELIRKLYQVSRYPDKPTTVDIAFVVRTENDITKKLLHDIYSLLHFQVVVRNSYWGAQFAEWSPTYDWINWLAEGWDYVAKERNDYGTIETTLPVFVSLRVLNSRSIMATFHINHASFEFRHRELDYIKFMSRNLDVVTVTNLEAQAAEVDYKGS